jgi:hypothetical protein
MPEFPVTLVPVAGGYAVHTTGCDCKEASAKAPGRRSFASQSVEAALAEHYRRDGGPTAPDRVVRRLCASNIPMTDLAPMTWTQHHQYYVNEAARYLVQFAGTADYQARQTSREVLSTVIGVDGERVPWWWPSSGDTRSMIRKAHQARAMARVVHGVEFDPKDDDACMQVVTQAEAVLRDELETLTETGTGYADAMDRAYAEAERYGAGQVVQILRSTLAKVHAHRTLRDAVR